MVHLDLGGVVSYLKPERFVAVFRGGCLPLELRRCIHLFHQLLLRLLPDLLKFQSQVTRRLYVQVASFLVRRWLRDAAVILNLQSLHALPEVLFLCQRQMHR